MAGWILGAVALFDQPRMFPFWGHGAVLEQVSILYKYCK
jgi:hypothetical protein